MSIEKLTIKNVGAKGDGIAQTDQGSVFVPFTMAGEQVTASVSNNRATVQSIDTASLERVKAPCPHFGPNAPDHSCGGCSVQHFSDAAYSAWKRDIVVSALAKAGIDHPVEDLISCAPKARRRAVFTAQRDQNDLKFGFLEAGSHNLVAITECMVLSDHITRHLTILRDLAKIIGHTKKPLQMSVLAAENGLDIAITGDFKIDDRIKKAVVAPVTNAKTICRLAFNNEILIELRPPYLTFGQAVLSPPPGNFVQASAQAEAKMVEIVSDYLSSCKKIADLFSGCGTFSFPLAKSSAVHAVENHKPALQELDRAVRQQQGLKPLTHELRDLFRRPLMADELKFYNGALFDPPRAGAELQAKELAKKYPASKLKKIAAVSCNPVSLARDLKILTDGGFKIEKIIPIDQFLWSGHVEVVALLKR